MKKKLLLSLIALFGIMGGVMADGIQKYTPTNRVTELQGGKSYIVYFAGLPTGQDRTGLAYERGGDQVGFYRTTKPHTGFATTSNRFLWTVTAASDANGYYIQNVGTSKYVGSDGRANKDAASEVYIYQWKANGVESAGVDVEGADGTRVANASSSFKNEKVWVVKNNASEYWHANVGSFTTWNSGHPVAFYEYSEENVETVDYTINFAGTGTGTVKCGETVLSNGQTYTSSKLLSSSDITVEGCNYSVVVDDINMAVTVNLYGLPKVSTASEKFYYTLKDTKGRNRYAYYNGDDQFLGTDGAAGNDNRYFYFTQSAAQVALSTADYKVVSIHNVAADGKEMTAMNSWGTAETNWYIKLSPQVSDANYIAVCPNKSFGNDSWNDYSTNIQGWGASDNNSAWEFASVSLVEYTVQVQGLPSTTNLAGVTVRGVNYNNGAKVVSGHRDAFISAMTVMEVPGYTSCLTGYNNNIRVAYTEKIKTSAAPENGEWAANTTWYYIQQRNNGYISTGSNYKDGTGFKVNQTTKPTDDNGLWAVVEDNGTYKFYNKGAGVGSVISFTATTDNTKAAFAEIANAANSNFILEPGVTAGTWCVRIDGTTNARWNNRGNYLATWTSNDSFYGGGNQANATGTSGQGATGSQYVFEIYEPSEDIISSWNNYSGDNQTEWTQGTDDIVTANTANKTSHYYNESAFRTTDHFGSVTLRFQYGSGSNGSARLDISGVELLNADGTEVLSYDIHNGFTGNNQSNRDYTITIPAKNTDYKLRIWTYGTRNSHGTITYMNWGNNDATELEKAIAIQENVYPFGGNLGEYHFSGNKTTGFDEAVNACQSKDDLKDLLSSIAINQPKTGKFYTIKNAGKFHKDGTNHYWNGTWVSTNVDKNTIFYLDNESHLIQYGTGYYANGQNVPNNIVETPQTYTFTEGRTTWGTKNNGVDIAAYGDYCIHGSSMNGSLMTWENSAHGTMDGTADPWAAWIIEEIEELPITMNLSDGAYYGTINLPVAVTLPAGLKAYSAVSGKDENGDDVLNLTKVADGDAATAVLAANTPVILYYSEKSNVTSLSISLSISNEAGAKASSNELEGTIAAETVTANANYVLSGKNGIGFYKYTGATMPGFKAYLPAAAAEVAAFRFNFDEIETAIRAIESENNNAEIYDLNGRRVQKAQKGLYIVNGKKVMFK